jgi:hypothetical protein
MKGKWVKPGRLFLSILILGAVAAGCNKEDMKTHEGHEQHDETSRESKEMNSDDDFRKSHKRLGLRTILELLQARWATYKYRDLQAAKDDGYRDIGVIVENMGHHYMKDALVDEKFDASKPEILVYNKLADGRFKLVAVEYAVPIEKTPNKAPRGFTGDADVWDRNTGFGLWLLHAWVWYKNPSGVFSPTNPDVHTH